MPAGCRGWAHHVSGWSGNVTLTDGVDTVTVSPTGYVLSALDIWRSLAEGAAAQWPGESFVWGLSEIGGRLWLTSTLSLTLGFTGTLAAQLGFVAGGTALAWTAPGYAVGLVGDDAVLFTDDLRARSGRGMPGYGRAHQHVTPGTVARAPRVEAIQTVARALAWQDDAELWTYPGRIDVYTDPMAYTRLDVLSYQCRAVGIDGHHKIAIAGARA